MDVQGSIGVITGAASGIGRELALALASKGAKGLALVDRSDTVHAIAQELHAKYPEIKATPYIGDVTAGEFRQQVYQSVRSEIGPPTLCIPAAGIAQPNHLAVRLDKETGETILYPAELLEQTFQINTVACCYWAMEMIAGVAAERRRRGLGRWALQEREEGVVILIGSIFSRGARGQLAYAISKGAITAAAGTLRKEGIHFGIRCGLIHPGFVDTPMVRAMGEEFIAERILPATRLGRLIRPSEIADAIVYMIENPAADTTLWVDAGWNDPG